VADDDRVMEGVYGEPPRALAQAGAGAAQFSPLIPGAAALEEVAPESLAAMTMLAPPGAVERRRVLALALRALTPDAPLTAMAPKDKGGSRLGKELAAFGCEVIETAKRHHRICVVRRPAAPQGLDAAIAAGAMQRPPGLDLWSQPGVFSWDRVDPGSALLAAQLPAMTGAGADLGAGVGVLARRVLASAAVTRLHLVDIDRRAVEAARRNVDDPRATFQWADVRAGGPAAQTLDFVVMNPPFHDGGAEDRTLGQAFIRHAAALLRKGGCCWLVANRHLPYEAELSSAFAKATLKAEAGGYKVYEARR